MNPPDVSYEPVWPRLEFEYGAPKEVDGLPVGYLYTFDMVDYWRDSDGDPRAVFSEDPHTGWVFIGDRDNPSYKKFWEAAPQSARDHLTALAALHR